MFRYLIMAEWTVFEIIETICVGSGIKSLKITTNGCEEPFS